MKVQDVADYIESIAPLIEGDDGGLVFGSMAEEVKGIVVCWAPTLDVITTSSRLGCNLIISHEWLFYHKSQNPWLQNERNMWVKYPNLARLFALMSEGWINVLRYHRNLDIAEGGIADTLGEALGLKKESNCIKLGYFTRLYTIQPIILRNLAYNIGKKLDTKCHVYGQPQNEIKYVGTAHGGVGQTFTYAEEFLNTPTQVIIFGEILEYTGIYTRELGFSYIVTSHEATETPGLIKLANLLKQKFPKFPNIHFVNSAGHYRYDQV